MFLLHKAALTLLSFTFALTWSATPTREVRCAFDIGSGETRFSAIAVERGKNGITYSKLASGSQRVPIKRAVVDGLLPESVAQELTTLLLKFKNTCESHGAKAFAGVATSGCRAAEKNGAALLARIGSETSIRLSVVRGDQEAILGYRAAEAQTPQRDRSRLIVWDIGGGSQQLAARRASKDAVEEFEIAALENWGAAAFKDRMEVQLGRKERKRELNPLSESETKTVQQVAHDLALREIPATLRNRAKRGNPVVVGIGGVHNEALLQMTRLHIRKGKRKDEAAYTLDDVRNLQKLLIGKTTEQLRDRFPETGYAEYLPSNVALVLGIMNSLGIQQVRAQEVNLTDGLAADEAAWR